MTTAMYRLVPGAGFVCTITVDGVAVAREQHTNIGVLMAWRARHYPDAVTVSSKAQPAPRPHALQRCDWCGQASSAPERLAS